MNPYLLINIKQLYRPEAPINYESMKVFIKNLSHRTKVVCALEAAKLVLPVWEKFITLDGVIDGATLDGEQKESPQKTIEIVEKWCNGNATKDEVKEARINAWAVADMVFYNSKAHNAIGAAALSAMEVTGGSGYSYAIEAVYCASSIYYNSAAFYNEWWNRCYPLIQNDYDLLDSQISGDI